MKKDLKLNDLEFTDFPRQISVETYREQRNYIVEYFKTHHAVAAIYEIGSINDPGISDLDIILSIRKNNTFSKHDFEFLATLDSDVFIHQPFAIPEDLFPYLPYLFYASNLKILAGEENHLFCEPEFAYERKTLDFLICSEAAIGRLCDLIYQTTIRQHLSIRKMLLKLNSIKHNIKLYKNLNGSLNDPNWDKFITEITQLRKSWFSLQRKEQIEKTLRLLSCGITVLLKIIDNLCSNSHDIVGEYRGWENVNHAYYIFPNSLQVIKFDSFDKTTIKTLPNPAAFMGKISGRCQQKIVKHVNSFSVISMPCVLLCLFAPAVSSNSDTERSIKGNFSMRDENITFEWKNPRAVDLFKLRFNLLDNYKTFITTKGFSTMSPLIMAPWFIEGKAKLYELKKQILKGIIKSHII